MASETISISVRHWEEDEIGENTLNHMLVERAGEWLFEKMEPQTRYTVVTSGAQRKVVDHAKLGQIVQYAIDVEVERE